MYDRDHDDYSSILAKALADRLAEAFAEWLHAKVRREWGFGRQENLTPEDLVEEKYRGIRPAPGYPACPDHTEKRSLFTWLDAGNAAGMTLTESCAMLPAASVSGLYFAHPESRYFAVDRITREQVESYAVFGEAYFDLTEDITLTAGLRYSKDDKRIETASGTFVLNPFFIGEADFDKVTGRAVVNWNPDLSFTADTNVYLSFSRGFKSGGFNPGNNTIPVFESEVIDAYELGTKNSFLDGKGRVNVAIFNYDYSNLIVGNLVGTAVLNTNIPESQVRGAEVELELGEGRLLEGLALDLDLAAAELDAVPVALEDVRLVARDPQRAAQGFEPDAHAEAAERDAQAAATQRGAELARPGRGAKIAIQEVFDEFGQHADDGGQ